MKGRCHNMKVFEDIEVLVLSCRYQGEEEGGRGYVDSKSIWCGGDMERYGGNSFEKMAILYVGWYIVCTLQYI